MFQPLDGPAKSGKLSTVTTTTPVEVKKGVSAWNDRQVVTLQGDGKFYVYLADTNETPSDTTIIANGFVQFKDVVATWEASATQIVWVLSFSGTVNIRFSERG